ncbi:methionine synthase [candidate division WOR-3 bacterium]|nr:methionine synthase [candidate division WOR-3 bacterium]
MTQNATRNQPVVGRLKRRASRVERRASEEGFLSAARERIVLFDGGMGTALSNLGVEPGGCHELFNRTRPDLVYQAHAGFLAAGAHVIETNSFGGARHTLAEHGLGADCRVLNRRAAEIARRAVAAFPRRAGRRYVAGSIGPGSKLPSLGQIDADELSESFLPQVLGLLDGGVDCLIIETCQDLVQLRAALFAAEAAFEHLGRHVPVIAQVTIDEHGRTLTGSDVPAVLAALEPLPIAALGLNCGLGPEGLSSALRYLAGHSSHLVSFMPNAGLPQLVDGRPVYDLSPADFAAQVSAFCHSPGLNICGGCCGTTPEHIGLLARTLKGTRPRKPARSRPMVSSLFSAQEVAVKPAPFIVGERTNASGSKRFRELLLAHDFDGMVAAACAQSQEGAHAVDLSVAAAGRDELHDMRELCNRLNRSLEVAVMVDSTDPAVVEAALSRLGGRSLVNSVNLEDEPRARRTIELCRRHGAALVLMTIDRQGMAMTAERKLEVADRLYDLAVKQGRLDPAGIFFDLLTFTLAGGDERTANAAAETLKAIRQAKRHFRQSFFILGVSNVSYGFAPPARRALNTVFLARAVEHGLDAAILHAGRIEPLSALKPAAVRACDDLIFRPGPESLRRFLDHFARTTLPVRSRRPEADGRRERLRAAIVAGDRAAAIEATEQVLQNAAAASVIDKLLLPAMAEVGRRFESGRMQLPFVLRSAEAMQAALELVRPKLDKASAATRGTMLIATVRGDVHDIGKNLVAMVLSSNGFDVVNLGVRRTAEDIIAAARECRPDAIGLSGLLVESARAMKEYCRAFAAAGLAAPVICGGAALRRDYVEKELAPEYPAGVHYAKDAMAGLTLMQRIVAAPRTTGTVQPPFSESGRRMAVPALTVTAYGTRAEVDQDDPRLGREARAVHRPPGLVRQALETAQVERRVGGAHRGSEDDAPPHPRAIRTPSLARDRSIRGAPCSGREDRPDRVRTRAGPRTLPAIVVRRAASPARPQARRRVFPRRPAGCNHGQQTGRRRPVARRRRPGSRRIPRPRPCRGDD